MSLLAEMAKDSGRLYLMKFYFRGVDAPVFKIGVTDRENATDRFFEVVRDFYVRYRYVPECGIKRDRKCKEAYMVEATLRRYFKEFQYVPEKKHDGSTELFLVEEGRIIDVYERCVKEGVGWLKEV